MVVNSRFRNFAWGLLAYNILVILWGAYVRASGSGAGCGNHWPDCQGSFIPKTGITAEQAKTWVESIHRASTEMLGPLLLILVIWAFRAYAKGHVMRRAAFFVIVFTIIEALIGRHLVKNDLTAGDTSTARAIWLSLHLVNTFALMASLTLMAWWASGRSAITLRGQGAMGFAILMSVAATVGLAVTGALAALGDTVFPVASREELLASIQRDLSSGSVHLFEHLRTFHPYTALSVGLWVILVAGLCGHLRPSPQTTFWMRATISLFILETGWGLLNLFLLAPMWMQMSHLLVANLLWISLVLLAASALAVDCRRVEFENVEQVFAARHEEMPAHAIEAAALAAQTALENPTQVLARATWKDYLALTKPRVISLLWFTTTTAMFIGAGGWPGAWLLIATGVGLYMAAGASNAINMVCERDLDLKMERTSKRPTLTSVPPPHALWFAFVLALGSFGLLWGAANLLAALMALSGLVVYVIVYTLLLKRRTWSNIVIGGAAGAFPPLVGYAAVTNTLSPLAWFLFALVFVWTPVHFWALALLIKDDYAKAGVPMLPVVLGDRHTVLQIGAYTIVTIIMSLAPFVLREGQNVSGWIYGVSMVALNAILLWRAVQLYQNPTRPRASSLFHYSMLYLALLFLALAVDRSLIG